MDKQVQNLAKQLAREGISPDRDLWPGIDQAINKAEQRTSVRQSFNSNAWLRMAAVAATLILLVGSGYFTQGSQYVRQDHQSSLLQTLNHTISDLDAAMAMDPENINLTRLSMMTHKSRAHLLRAGTRR